MGMDLNQYFDYGGGNDFVLGLFNDLGPMASSISMPTAPAPSKATWTWMQEMLHGSYLKLN